MTPPQKQDELCPKLWSKLPRDTLGFIFKKLPAIDLFRLRTLNKEWIIRFASSEFPLRNFDQSHSALLLFIDRRLVIYKSKSSSWHQKYLEDFLPSSSCVLVDTCITPSRWELIAWDGGFLCFTARDLGHFFVSNPITKQFIHLEHPDKSSDASSSATGVKSNNINDSSSSGEPPVVCNIYKGEQVLGGLRVDTGTGHFMLLIATLRGNGLRTHVYSSQNKSWKRVADFPLSIVDPNLARRLSINMGSQMCNPRPTCILCDDSFYTLVKVNGVLWELLRFDIQTELWSKVPLRRRVQFHLQLSVYEGKLMLVVQTHWFSRYNFFVMQNSDSGVTSWISVLQPLSQQLESFFLRPPREFRFSCCLSCVNPGGDTIYFVTHDHKGDIVVTCEPKNLRFLIYNLQTQLLMSVEVGKNVMDLNLAESNCCAFRPAVGLLAS